MHATATATTTTTATTPVRRNSPGFQLIGQPAKAPEIERIDKAGTTTLMDANSALAHVEVHMVDLVHQAKAAQRSGQKIRDQDFKVEVIRMTPSSPSASPVVIIGGMGPLAGAQAMQAALGLFADTRELVLLQLCSTPDRTPVVKHQLGHQVEGGNKRELVLDVLASGFEKAQANVTAVSLGKAHTVVACNTAHNFVGDAFALYERRQGAGATMASISMVECVVEHLKDEKRPVLLLGTDGTRLSGLYTSPLTKVGVKCVNLEESEMGFLMNAIYEGVKAFDPDKTVVHGQQLLDALRDAGKLPEGKCVVLAACTEVPEIISTLKEKGSEAIKKALEQFEVVDPMQVTLRRIAAVDAQHAEQRAGATAAPIDPDLKA